MSRLSEIGKRLYGETWQSDLARNLKNAEGEELSRKTIQSCHKRDTLPEWLYSQLENVTKQREEELKEAKILIDNIDIEV